MNFLKSAWNLLPVVFEGCLAIASFDTVGATTGGAVVFEGEVSVGDLLETKSVFALFMAVVKSLLGVLEACFV